MLDKPWEFWAAIVGMAIWTVSRDAEVEPLRKRMGKTLASGLLTVATAPIAAPFVWDNEIAAAVLIMAFGLLILDIVSGLLSDREFLKDLIRRRIGGGK